MPVHITDTGQATDGALADGIRYAADNGADVINVSFGKHEQSNAISTAVTYARNRGAIIVAAAGNEGPGTGVTYPAALSGVIAVGATDRTDHWASFSCTGPELDLVAPGVDVWTWWTDPDSYWLEPVLGTSFASPLVAGVVALMLSRNPELTAAEIETILMETADDLSPEGRDPQTGFGLLDAEEAVDRSTPSDDTAFADVGDDHPYRAAITGMAAAGLITGFGDHTFRPEEAVKRAQFAKMVDGALEIAVTEDLTSPFTDLGPDDSDTLYPHEYVAAAYANNITVGLTQSTFGPFRDVNRAQAISMLVRAVQRMRPGALSAPPPGYTGSVRTVSPAHDGNLRTAEYNGLLDGISGLGPDWDAWGAASRGEIAQMLWTVFLSR